MKLGIYVGSFNPVHIGHIKIVKHLIDNSYLDKVIIIPTGNYWDKTNLLNIKHRINMLKFYETDKIKIDKTHNNIKYTYQLLDKLKEDYPNDTLYLILGADNIITLDKWKNIHKILEHQILVINRNNIDIQKYINNFTKKENFNIINNFKEINISSTKIRELIKENNLNNLYKFLDKQIIEYILKHNIYK